MDLNDDASGAPLDLTPEGIAALLRVGRPLGPSTVFMPRPSQFKPATFPEVPAEVVRRIQEEEGIQEGMSIEEMPEGSIDAVNRRIREHAETERARVERRFSQVVGNLWDRIRTDLGETNGYADLLRLRDSLASRAKPYERQKLVMDLRGEHAGTAHLELGRVEKELFGPMPSDTKGAYAYRTSGETRTLRALYVCDRADGWEKLPSDLEGWSDEFRKINPDAEFTPAEGLTFTPPFPSYIYEPRPEWRVWGPSRGAEYERLGLDPAELWASFEGYHFDADDTFGQAGERITNDLRHTTRERTEVEDLLGVIGLRLTIVGSVLYEHELYGYVPTWEDLLPGQKEGMLRPSAREVVREMAKDRPRNFLALCTLLDWLDKKRQGALYKGSEAGLARAIAGGEGGKEKESWLPDDMSEGAFKQAVKRGAAELTGVAERDLEPVDFCKAVLENKEAIEAARPASPSG